MSKKKTATETMMEESEKLRKKWLDSFDERLSKIERRLKAYFNCPFCGFDQGKPDPYFGTGLTPTFMKLMKGVDTDVKTATETMMEGRMKFMNTINELQKKLTKLRREVQRSEAPKAGECNIVEKLCSRDPSLDCPIHIPGCKLCKYWYKYEKDKWAGDSRPIDRPTKEHILTPDLPLHVRVARDLRKIADVLEEGGINEKT